MANFNLADYETVKERKKRFYTDFPDGRISVELQNKESILEYALIRAEVYCTREDQKAMAPRGVGFALEIRDIEAKRTSTGKTYESVNFSSWTENCFHGDTEILTKDGWQTISDYIETSYGKPVASYDLKHNFMSFDLPIKSIIQDNRDLYEITDSLTAQCVTIDHDVVVGSDKIKASEIKDGNTYDLRFSMNTKLTGSSFFPSETWARFAQWIIADGNLTDNLKTVRFGFKKERKVQRLISILNQLPFQFKTSIDKNAVHHIDVSSCNSIIQYLPNKSLNTDLVLKLTKPEANAFIEEIEFTDGTPCTKGTGAIFLRQTDKKYADNLLLLASLNGWFVSGCREVEEETNFGKNYFYHQRISKKHRRSTTDVSFHSNQTVYCLTMPKGTLVTKWNGKLAISGNCEESAVGRALDNAGYASNSKCSAEEMAKAQRMQQTLSKASKSPTEAIDSVTQANAPLNQVKPATDDYSWCKECKRRMYVSKYDPNVIYCIGCKKKKPAREGNQEDELPF